MDHAEFPELPAAPDASATGRRTARRPKRRRSFAPDWEIADELPAELPVTPAEVEIFEAYFGAVLDELLAKRARDAC
jgi:hypothetical protein